MPDNRTVFERITAGGRVAAAVLLDFLEQELPLIGRLASTEQDPEWHAEGNVRIHTERVIDEVFDLLETETVAPDQRLALVIGAALHDIGKPLTTRKVEIDGKMRVVSPRHAMRGRSYAALRLGGLRPEVKANVLSCIGYHHHPRQVVTRHGNVEREYRRLARCADLRMLYLLEIGDLRGRDCNDLEDELETLELFRISAEELDLWNNRSPYAEWRKTIEGALPDAPPLTIDFVEGYAIRDYEVGLICMPEEALARTYEHRNDFAEVVVTCGVSGCGKSTWVAQNLPEYRIVSLDAIREELTGKEDDQSRNGEVLQLAKERLRESLRRRENVVWESIGLRRDGRAAVIDLAHNYHATTRIVAFDKSPAETIAQNRKRVAGVPLSVIDRQLDRMEWPEVTEADRVEVLAD